MRTLHSPKRYHLRAWTQDGQERWLVVHGDSYRWRPIGTGKLAEFGSVWGARRAGRRISGVDPFSMQEVEIPDNVVRL